MAFDYKKEYKEFYISEYRDVGILLKEKIRVIRV